MSRSVDHERTLPAMNERREILERAELILARARALNEMLAREEGGATWSATPGSSVALGIGLTSGRRASTEVALEA